MSEFLNALKSFRVRKIIEEDKEIIISKKKLKKKKIIIEEKKEIVKKKKKVPYNYIPTPLVVVKKDLSENLDELKVRQWLSTIEGLIEGSTRTVDDKPTRLYDYQVAHIKNKSKFRCIEKARQTGFSFVFSAEALGKSHLCNVNTSIFISYNQEEADEKILNCKQLYESMPLAYQKKRVTDNKHSMIFKNSKGQMTRIISTAQRPPRGKGFNTDVYLDEFAFFIFGDKVFTASVPVVTRGTGVMTVGSTPYGGRGKFWLISQHPKDYPQFSRQRVPWWHCPDLCKNILVAFREAPGIPTDQRVLRFASPTMRVIFESMPLDDFQQEYELAFIDENVSYFPIQIINQCCYRDVDDFSYDEIVDKKDSKIVIPKAEKSLIESKYQNINFFQCDSIEELSGKIMAGEISLNLIAGFDVGRKKDKSELTVIEEIELEQEQTLHVVRFTCQFDREKFETQKEFLRKLMKIVPIKKIAIDAMGIGMNLAEDMFNQFPGRVDQIDMVTDWKDRAAQSTKIRFESQLIAIPDDDKLKRQIGSIKKKVSDTGFVRYDAEKDKEHHGDKFWSLALASMMGVEPSVRISKIDSKVIAVSGRFLNHNGNNLSSGYLREIKIGGKIPRLSEGDSFGNVDAPGLGNLPSPIQEYLSPGNYIDIGSHGWPTLNEFLTPTRKR